MTVATDGARLRVLARATPPVLERLDVPSDDVAHARFALSQLPDPRRELRRLIAAAPPGGVVAVEDVDWRGGFCYPPSGAFDRFAELYPRALRARGGDPTLGSRLLGMLADAGLVALGVHVEQPVGSDRRTKLLAALLLEDVGEDIVDAGLIEPDTLVRDLAELRLLADDPRTLVGLPRVVQAWGRVPAPAAQISPRRAA